MVPALSVSELGLALGAVTAMGSLEPRAVARLDRAGKCPYRQGCVIAIVRRLGIPGERQITRSGTPSPNSSKMRSLISGVSTVGRPGARRGLNSGPPL